MSPGWWTTPVPQIRMDCAASRQVAGLSFMADGKRSQSGMWRMRKVRGVSGPLAQAAQAAEQRTVPLNVFTGPISWLAPGEQEPPDWSATWNRCW
jgi:hypothetical protein